MRLEDSVALSRCISACLVLSDKTNLCYNWFSICFVSELHKFKSDEHILFWCLVGSIIEVHYRLQPVIWLIWTDVYKPNNINSTGCHFSIFKTRILTHSHQMCTKSIYHHHSSRSNWCLIMLGQCSQYQDQTPHLVATQFHQPWPTCHHHRTGSTQIRG